MYGVANIILENSMLHIEEDLLFYITYVMEQVIKDSCKVCGRCYRCPFHITSAVTIPGIQMFWYCKLLQLSMG